MFGVFAADEEDVSETFGGDDVGFCEGLVYCESRPVVGGRCVVAAVETTVDAVVGDVERCIELDGPAESSDGKLACELRHLFEKDIGSR